MWSVGWQVFRAIIRIGVKHLFCYSLHRISLWYSLGEVGSARFAFILNLCAEEARKGIRLVTPSS